jgi:lysophospholipase L1-like esterase
MSMIRSFARSFVALSAAAVAVGCDHDADVFMPEPTDDLFARYAAIGNSITAGVQSDGINNTTQQQSYAFLLAGSMRTRFAYPALAGRGCVPPIADWQTGARSGTGSTSTTCDLRDANRATDILNNVAVPGAGSTEVNSAMSAFHNALTTLFLGGKTQVQRALEVDPTFATVWIGNNDVLQAAGTGIVTPTAGISRGITPVATFQQNYDAMVTALQSGAPDAEGVMIGVVQTTAAPLVFPVAVFNDAAYLAGFSQAAGGQVTVHPNCQGSGALVSFAILPQMRSGAHPRLIACAKNTVPGTAVGEIFILDTDDQNAIATAVTAYNAHIQAKATQLGWAYVNPNTVIATLRQEGCILPFPNLAATATTSPFGPCVSLDGIHPSARGQARIANAVIAAINTAYSATLPTVTVP